MFLPIKMGEEPFMGMQAVLSKEKDPFIERGKIGENPKGHRKAPGKTALELGMKESYKEDLANQFGLELYADGGNVMGIATTEVYAG